MKYTEVLHQNLHMQGFTSDGANMYWSFTDSLVKTTKRGTVLRQVPYPAGHLGDIDYYDGYIYGTVWQQPSPKNGEGMFHVCVFDAETLAVSRIIRLEACYAMAASGEDGFRGVDGIAVGCDPETGEAALMTAVLTKEAPEYDRQMILQFDFEGNLQKKHYLYIGNTCLGIQNLDYDAGSGEYWITVYNARYPYQNPHTLYRIAPDLHTVRREYDFHTAYGFHCLGGGRYYASLQNGVNGNRGGFAYEADNAFLECPMRDEDATVPTIMPLFDSEIGL